MLAASALVPWLEFPALAAFSLCAGLLFFVIPKNGRIYLLVFSGCLLWVFWRGRPGPLDLRRHMEPGSRSMRLRFQVQGDADEMVFHGQDPALWVPVRAKAYYQSGQWQKSVGRVQVRMPAETAPRFLPGTVWEATGVLTSKQASYVGLYRADWIFRPDPGALRSVSGDTGSWMMESVFRMRERCSAGIQKACEGNSEVSAVLQALLLGRRNELDRDTLQIFVRTGLVHVFAVSGLHLGLLSAMLAVGCRWLGVSPRWIPCWVLPLLMLFTIYTGLRASALRALIMITCFLCSATLYRKANMGYAFALALVVILGIAPAQIYDVGFQYSFLLVGGLLAFGKICSEQTQEWFAADPWAPQSSAREFRHRHLWPRLQGAVLVSLLCFVVAAPLTAHVFHLFSPIGIVGNLLAVPLVFCLLATGFPGLFFVGLPAGVSAFFLLPARWCASLLLQWVDVLERVPGGTQWVKSPPLWMLFVFYGALICWWRWPRQKNWVLAVLLGVGAYAGTSAWLDYRRPELGIIDADRGQSAWLRLPGKGIVLVDTGSDWSGRTVTRILQEQGIDRIDCLILTHPDRNHVGGTSRVCTWLEPERILISTADRDHPQFENLRPKPQTISRGELVDVGGWNLEVLHPAENPEDGSSDSRSLVLRFTHGFSSILIMGGAGERVERELLASGDELEARLLIAGHPRAGDRVNREFLEKVDPEAVLYSGREFTGVSPERLASESRTAEAGVRVLRLGNNPSWVLFPSRGSF